MKVTFISNYINHHQIPFCNSLYRRFGGLFHFIQTEPMEEERLQMGWSAQDEALPYVIRVYEDEYTARRLIAESDVTLVGWTRREDIVKERLDGGRLTIRISERIYREGQWKAVSPRGLIKKYQEHTKYRSQNVYLLCAGAYAASDFHLIHAYPGKMFRFGYFPETCTYSREQFSAMKAEGGPLQMIWAGRFLPLKHPEFVTRLAWNLKKAGISFHIHMVGSGELEEMVTEQIREKNLRDVITLYGFRTPDEVRKIMEKCHIHLFTSSHLEGWGAVINEAMNSGCAVVANSQVGAAPYLIRHGDNGLVYKEGIYEDFEAQVRYLCYHRKQLDEMGRQAYETIVGEWNASHAVDELVRFCDNLKSGFIQPPESGPFSVAPVTAPGKMYCEMMRKLK